MCTTFKDHCPLCGSLSFDGKPCQPACDPGSLHRVGIDLVPIERGAFGGPSEVEAVKKEDRRANTQNSAVVLTAGNGERVCGPVPLSTF